MGVPAGHLGHGGTDGTAEELARAELAEETGMRRRPAARTSATSTWRPGLMTQGFDVWLATELPPGPPAREATEADMRSAFVPEAELRAMIARRPVHRRPLAGRLQPAAARPPA